MQITAEKVDTILSLVGILSLLSIWHWGLKRYFLDSFRQNIFLTRGKMFVYAAEGNIDFNHPAYGTIRTLMNGYIRFADRIDFFPMLVLFLLTKKETEKASLEFNRKLESEIASLNPGAQKELREYLKRTENEVVKHLILSSFPLFAVLLIPAFVIALLIELLGDLSKLTSHLKEKLRLMDSLAFSEVKRHSAA